MWGNELVLKLRIKPEEVLQRLGSAMRPLPQRPWKPLRFQKDDLVIVGRVMGNSFEIYCVTDTKDLEGGRWSLGVGPVGFSISDRRLGLGPTFQGQVEKTEFGSIVRGSFRPALSGIVMGMLLGSVLIGTVAMELQWPIWAVGIGLGMWGCFVYWGNVVLSRWGNGNITQKFLYNIFAHALIRDSKVDGQGKA